jgi:putative DNA primase/helicase
MSSQNSSPKSRLLRLSKGVDPTQSPPRLESWEIEFSALSTMLLKRPETGQKIGEYYVRGALKDGEVARNDANIVDASLLVLDGDATLDPESGEVIKGAPDPQLIHDALKRLDLPHLIHTTASHLIDDKGNRYRVLIPATIEAVEALSACVEWTIQKLHQSGVWIADVRENHTWSQPWYLPRLAANDAEYLCLVHETESDLDVGLCRMWAAKQDPMREAILNALEPSESDLPRGQLYLDYDLQYGTPEAMIERLEAHGYVYLSAHGKVNGEVSYRLKAPGSESGSAGVVLFKSRRGHWAVFSHHGSHDPLATRHAHDAFDLFRILEHGGNHHAAVLAWQEEQNPRPVIQIQAGELAAQRVSAIAALADLDPPRVFQRGPTLCRIAYLEESTVIEGCHVPKGTATIITLQRMGLFSIMAEVIRWERYNTKSQSYVPADPCTKTVNIVLESAGEWDGVPVLLGILEAPLLLEDGRVLAESGYDPATRLYVEGRFPHFALSEKICLADAQQARDALLKPFEEFPFVDEALDRSVLLAYLITLVLRPLLPTSPMFCISATTPGTGKGLLIEACNLLVRGRDAALMPAVQGSNAEEETRKRITALLLQGVSSINLDNWIKVIGGEAMNTLLTTGEWSDRILGRSEIVKFPARITLAATGNNLMVRGDMTRRALLLRLNAGVERPELRQFKQTNLTEYVLEHRGTLLASLFTILKGFLQAGRPLDGVAMLGRFEKWSSQVAAVLCWLGMPNPIDSIDLLKASDPESERLSLLFEALWSRYGSQWISVSDLVRDAEMDATFSQVPSALKDALVEIAGDGRGGINRKTLGWQLKHFDGRIVNGFCLIKRARDDSSTATNQYRIESTRADVTPPEKHIDAFLADLLGTSS